MKLRFLFLILAAALSLGACNHHHGHSGELTQEELLANLDAKIKKHPKNAELYFNRAKILLNQRRVNDAINDLIHAVDLDGKEEKYLMLLGDAYFANGDMEHSYKVFQEVIDNNADNDEAMLKLGEIAYYCKDYDRAMENLSKVTAKDKDNRTALFMKAFIYEETGDTAKAVTLLGKVCNLYPEYEQAFEELGLLYSARHNALALEYLNTAHQLDPNNTNVLYATAMFFQEGGEYDKAEELYKQILDINPNHADAWHNRGYLQLNFAGNYDLAIEYFTRALQVDSRSVNALVNRGRAYEEKGVRDLALTDFEAANQIEPNNIPAQQGLKRVK